MMNDYGSDDMPMPALRGAVNAFMPASPAPVQMKAQAPQQAPQAPVMAAPPVESITEPNPIMALADFVDRHWGERKDKDPDKLKELRETLKELQAKSTALSEQAAKAPGASDGATASIPTTPVTPGTYEDKVGNFESSDNDTAVNPNTLTAGRYQFAPSTAEGIRRQHPELGISDNWRKDKEDQRKLMKVYTDTSRDILRPQLGRDPTGGELYMLHLLGHGKGPSVLAQLNRPITETTSDQERKFNPFLNNYKTGADLLAYFNKRFG